MSQTKHPLDNIITNQEVRDQLDNMIVMSVLNNYSVKYFDSQSGLSINLISPNKRSYNIVINMTSSREVYSIWVEAKGKLLRCSSRDPEIEDLMFPLKVLQMLL